MSAQTATRTLPFRREEPVVDAAFTSSHSEVHIRTGPLDNEVTATVDLEIENNDRDSQVNVYWSMTRFKAVDGEQGRQIFDHPAPHTDISFGVDEIEAFATALYKAVQLAKQRGYIPA